MAKCKICKQPYQKRRMTQKVCETVECAQAYAVIDRHMKELKEIRARKLAIKPRGQWIKEAQIAFNAYIRERDKGKPCICCGNALTNEAIGGGFDAGHYRSIGSAPHLRFDERNCHGQRKQCNRYGAGRAVDYRIGLIARIGLAAVESLEADQSVKKYTIDDAQRIKAEYRAKLKALKGES
ncbi:MAG: recombination protein NinG [Betaproteobacteria bacterium]|nr:recombination protein NinG [Betaproteobacteria bacterium]